MTEPTPGVTAWLCTASGRDAVDLVTGWLDDGLDTLVAGTRLRTDGLDPHLATAAVGAASARRRARERWPQADRLLFTPGGLEQASDPQVAAWRARRLAGTEVWDLCAGLGSDALAIAAAGGVVTAVDLDAARLALLTHNATVLGLDVRTVTGDALNVRPPAEALVHADPSRRAEGRRLRRLREHRPPVGALLAAHRAAPGTAVVLSPAVDLADPDLPGDAEVEFVGEGAALREAVAWRGTLRRGVASATILPGEHHRARTAPPPRCEPGPVGSHLVEVHPAAVRARLHTEIALEVGARRLAERRALLTRDGPPPASPWYRAREVLAVLPARPRAVRRWLSSTDPAPIEIAVHGLEADPTVWWRALGKPPRGPRGWRLELVRTDAGGRAIVSDARPAR